MIVSWFTIYIVKVCELFVSNGVNYLFEFELFEFELNENIESAVIVWNNIGKCGQVTFPQDW